MDDLPVDLVELNALVLHLYLRYHHAWARRIINPDDDDDSSSTGPEYRAAGSTGTASNLSDTGADIGVDDTGNKDAEMESVPGSHSCMSSGMDVALSEDINKWPLSEVDELGSIAMSISEPSEHELQYAATIKVYCDRHQ